MRLGTSLLLASAWSVGCGLSTDGALDAPDGGDAERDAASVGESDGPATDASADTSTGADAIADASRDATRMPDARGAEASVDAGRDHDASMDAQERGDAETGAVDTGALDSWRPDAPALTYPATCAEAGVSGGTVTLYFGGNPSQPWTAVCDNGGEYVPLGSGNVSSYPAGGSCATDNGGSVTTTWTMIRIDPGSLIVDTSDYTGATSTGDTQEISGNGTYNHDYTQMPYASARTCVDGSPTSSSASINLDQTPFAVATSQTFFLLGFSNIGANNKPLGGASPSSGKQIALSVGGFPAGITPCQSDYYQTAGGACLQLVYSP
jgi:hypothetical protein